MISLRHLGYIGRIVFVCLVCLVCSNFCLLSTWAADRQPVTLTLPASTLHQILKDILPLPIQPRTKNRNFQGTFTLDSISQLAMKNNLISLEVEISGRDIRITAAVGGQSIQIKLGQIVVPITCDIALRFDHKKKILFLTPTFYDLPFGSDDSSAPLRPLLKSLSKEYALPFDKLAPLTKKIGFNQINVFMEPIDMRAEFNELVLKFLPFAQKNSINAHAARRDSR